MIGYIVRCPRCGNSQIHVPAPTYESNHWVSCGRCPREQRAQEWTVVGRY